MNNLIKLLACIMLLAALLYARFALPESTPTALPPAPLPRSNVLLAPLDSRPVCSTMVQKLGQLAGLNVILPPKAFLDNYQTPAKQEKLFQWLNYCVPYYEHSIISADLLLHGGLLAARQTHTEQAKTDALLNELAALTDKSTEQHSQAVFSVIPRLLVSDQLLPDRWYSYQLFRYSQLADMVRISGSYALTQKLHETEAKIPPEVLQKYQQLYQNSDKLNTRLLKLAKQSSSLSLTIGQDDAKPIGLPHASASRLESSITAQGLTNAQLTYGADEIASLLLVRYHLHKQGWQPKAYIMYATDKTAQQTPPYTPAAIATVLHNQLTLLGAKEADKPEDADLICYVGCGDKGLLPTSVQAEEISSLLNAGRHVALIDSSVDFEPEELLLPKLLAANAPVAKLAAYAGWNTFSNSSGTALAQGLIFVSRLRQLRQHNTSEAQYASLYADNLRFTTERILEDFYYQKLLHPSLRRKLEAEGIDPTNLSDEEKSYVEQKIQSKIALNAYKLLHMNLGRYPFYEQNTHSYYLRDLCVSTRLPWSRIFEAELSVWTHVGIAAKK